MTVCPITSEPRDGSQNSLFVLLQGAGRTFKLEFNTDDTNWRSNGRYVGFVMEVKATTVNLPLCLAQAVLETILAAVENACKGSTHTVQGCLTNLKDMVCLHNQHLCVFCVSKSSCEQSF